MTKAKSPKAGYTAFKEQEYNNIKTVLSNGLSITQASLAFNRSYGLVSMVKKTDNFEDYQTTMRKRYEKPVEETGFVRWVEQDNKKVRGIPQQALHTHEDLVVIELKKISNALEKLVEIADKKKGLFR